MYIFSAELMQNFGVRGRRLVAVETVVKPTPDMALVCRQGEMFHIGRLIHDDLAGLCAIEKAAYDLIFLSDVEVLGEPVGYCPAEHVNRKLITFRKIPAFR